MLFKKARYGKSNKSKKTNFEEKILKEKGWVPGANKYDLTIDWSKRFHANTGKFMQSPRHTMSDDIINNELKFNKPSPASYEDKWKKSSN